MNFLKSHINQARNGLSALPTWLKLFVTTTLILPGLASGLFLIILSFDAWLLIEAGRLIGNLPESAHGVALDYVRVGQSRHYYQRWFMSLLYSGAFLGIPILGLMWWPSRDQRN